MTSRKLFVIFVSLLVTLLVGASLVFADVLLSENYEIWTQTIDGGGREVETFSEDFDLTLSSSGQTVVGYSESVNYKLSGGYIAYSSPVEAEPGSILMDVKGLATDLTSTGIEVDQIVAVVDGQEFTASDVPVTEGQAMIHVLAKDQFDQTTEFDVNFTLDITPPTRPTLDSVETPALETPQMISGTKQADTAMWMIKDGEEFEIAALDELTTWSHSLDLNEGENIFQIFSKDQAGNESTRVDGNIYLDIYYPEVAIVYPAHNTTVNNPEIDILGTVGDDQTIVEVSTNWGEAQEALVENHIFTFSNLTLLEGYNVITAEARSPGGLRFSVFAVVYYYPDAIVPAPPTLNPAVSPINENTQTISGTKPVNTYLWLNDAKLGDGFFSAGTWVYTLSLNDNSNPLLLFVKDNAAPYPNVSSAVTDTIFYDSTPPTRPLVIDDGYVTTSTTSLHAKWSSDDAQTDIVDNQYAIGTTQGGQDIVPFTSIGTANQVTHSGLSLQQGRTYYFTVMTTNEAGSDSEAGYSDGIRVNGSVPRINDVTLADYSKIYQGTSGIDISVTAHDSDGDDLEYRFTIGGEIVQNWSSDSSYVWNVPEGDFGNIHVVVEVRDVAVGNPVGGLAYKDIRVFVIKKSIEEP